LSALSSRLEGCAVAAIAAKSETQQINLRIRNQSCVEARLKLARLLTGLDGVGRGYTPGAQLHGRSSARDQFEGDGLCPALLVALGYQFFHDMQSPAYITTQFVPTPLLGRGLGISPHNLQPSHTAAPTQTGVSLQCENGLSGLLSWGVSPGTDPG